MTAVPEPAVTRDTADALGSALGVLLGVSGAESVSLWGRGDDRPRLIAAAGDVEPARDDLRRVAAAALAGDTIGSEQVSLVGIPVPGADDALLVARDLAAAAGAHDGLLSRARPALAALLEGGTVDGEARAQRHLDRLRYDLHDGPQQDVHLLAQDLRLFRSQLAPMLSDHPDRERALGRLDDLEAQLIALDDALRRLSTSTRSPLLATGSLARALHQVVQAFTARTEIVPRTELRGDVESLTDSQRIAVLSLVREALANVRRHSEAERVEITITADEQTITAEVSDDGAGFDPDTTEPRAAQAGRLGLVGMHERMRMLGGHTRITSAPGGPTVIAASVPRWPVDPAAD